MHISFKRNVHPILITMTKRGFFGCSDTSIGLNGARISIYMYVHKWVKSNPQCSVSSIAFPQIKTTLEFCKHGLPDSLEWFLSSELLNSCMCVHASTPIHLQKLVRANYVLSCTTNAVLLIFPPTVQRSSVTKQVGKSCHCRLKQLGGKD